MVEKYINKCIDSIVEQTFSDFEVILIDDGSFDKCPQICDEYARMFSEGAPYVKVIHQINGGLSIARNSGLDIAVGLYTIFIDSDDFLADRNVFEKIAAIIEESSPDLIHCPFYFFYEEMHYKKLSVSALPKNKIVHLEIEVALNYLLDNNLFFGTAWCSVVKTSMIRNYNMRFEEKKLCEDVPWSAMLLANTSSIDYLDTPFCFYRQRNDSIIRSRNPKANQDRLDFVELGYSKLINDKSDSRKFILLKYYATIYLTALGYTPVKISKEERRQIKKLMPLLNYGSTTKIKIARIANKLFGYNLIRIMLVSRNKMKKK
jgi:glycosyltransferase involved in cell wall biosynthesis